MIGLFHLSQGLVAGPGQGGMAGGTGWGGMACCTGWGGMASCGNQGGLVEVERVSHFGAQTYVQLDKFRLPLLNTMEE